MHNRLNNRFFLFHIFIFFLFAKAESVFSLNTKCKYNAVNVYTVSYNLYTCNGHWSRKLNKEHNEPCMWSSSYRAKFDRAAEVCFYIMFKVRCHYFIQEINLLHKKGRPNKSILQCMLCWHFEFPPTEAPTMCTCRLFWS